MLLNCWRGGEATRADGAVAGRRRTAELTAVLLTTRKRASPRVLAATDHTPPSDEFMTRSWSCSGNPRTRAAETCRSPRLPLQKTQNLFFLRASNRRVRTVHAEKQRVRPLASEI